ncbi:MAG: TRAP transporter small permease [Lachnospiraceae bacterium]|nr:TRAP transporter small permease [Lachnospiraceae bacterium]
MKKIIGWLDDHFEEALMICLLAVISCVIMLQVIMRYFFNSAMAWPEELSRYCFVWSGLLSAGYCIRNGNAIKLDIVTSILPHKLARALEYLGKVLVLLTYGFFFYQSIALVEQTIAAKSLSTALRVPLQYVYASCLVEFGIGTLRQLEDLIRNIHGDLSHKEAAPTGEEEKSL